MKGGTTSDVVVVGAGVVGAACAMYLARSGFTVTVVDAAFPGSGATAAGMGHLVVMDDSEAQFALTSYSLSLWREVVGELGPFAEIETRGTLWIAADDVELQVVREKATYYAARAVPVEVLDAQATAQAEPLLARPLAGALLVPGDAVVYPPAAAYTFLDVAVRHGARVIPEWPVDTITSGTVSGPRGNFHAAAVVNAAGVHAARLSHGITLMPRRGHLAITDRYPGRLQHQIVELGYLKSAHEMTGESVAFNLQPRSTGQILVGSSRELGASGTGINEKILGRMIHRAIRYAPGLKELNVTRVWTGLRPTTPDKLPLIGAAPDDAHTWIAAGHEGLGITTSLGTGRLIADLIGGQPTAIDAAPFDPRRS